MPVAKRPVSVLPREMATHPTHTLAVYNARRDVWDQGGQSLEVRKQRSDLVDVALEYRIAGTNAPGSALWSQCRVHRGWLFIAYSPKVVHRAGKDSGQKTLFMRRYFRTVHTLP
jgi:hypothetical protein